MTPSVSIGKQQSIFSEAKRASEGGPRSRSDWNTPRHRRRRHQHARFVGRKRPCAEPTLVRLQLVLSASANDRTEDACSRAKAQPNQRNVLLQSEPPLEPLAACMTGSALIDHGVKHFAFS
jgi:hypothetical protein